LDLEPNGGEMGPKPLHPGAPTPLETRLKALGVTGSNWQIDYRLLPMRDGVRLATVVIRPRDGDQHPVVMERTPYTQHLPYDLYRQVFAAKWAVVIQNERGTGWSDGPFSLLGHVAEDAADTMTWIATQPWSNGRVALLGCSSPAENQLKISAEGHPALKAGVPMSAGAGVGSLPGTEACQGLFFKGGVPIIAALTSWYAPSGYFDRPHLPETADPDELTRAMRNFAVTSPSMRDPEFRARLEQERLRPPSGTVLQRLGVPASGYDHYMVSPPWDPAWEQVDLIHARHTGATPALNINGWMDLGAYETLKLFEFQQHHPDQYLIMAGSSHCAMLRAAAQEAWLGDRYLGDTRFPYDDVIVSWLRRWLTEDESAWTPMPKVQVFLMGASTWLSGDQWPLAATRERQWPLASTQGANTLWGDGTLGPGKQDGAKADTVIADPFNPVPSLGGGLGMDPICRDQRPVECRQDVLVYSSGPLTEGLAMVGDVTAVLSVSADVVDADVFVKLVDVYPDGTAYNLAWSCLRLRYRDGFDHEEALVPEEVYTVRIPGMATANYFAPGHRVRLEVAGSNFPVADRNWHTGGVNALEVTGPVAHLTVHHSPEHPSWLEFREYTDAVVPNQSWSRG